MGVILVVIMIYLGYRILDSRIMNEGKKTIVDDEELKKELYNAIEYIEIVYLYSNSMVEGWGTLYINHDDTKYWAYLSSGGNRTINESKSHLKYGYTFADVIKNFDSMYVGGSIQIGQHFTFANDTTSNTNFKCYDRYIPNKNWKKFESALLKALREKHPDWNVKYSGYNIYMYLPN